MLRSTTTALGVSAALTLLALVGCSRSIGPADAVRATATEQVPSTPSESAPVPPNELAKRLLTEDLGAGYTRKPDRVEQHDDVTVIGCPALERLGSNAATGSGLEFPRKAKASFTYIGSRTSEVSEELYSGSAAKLSKGISKVFDAMLSCPAYQVVSGSTVVDMSTQKSTAPDLGDEQWSQLLTFSAGGRRSIVKQVAVRAGTVVVVLSGSPGLVDAHLDSALAKARHSGSVPS